MSSYQEYVTQVKKWIEDFSNQIDILEIRENFQTQIKEVFDLIHAINLENISEQEVQNLHRATESLFKDINDYLNKTEVRKLKQENRIPQGQHKLPPLPYPYNALEPVISEEIMRLHHDKHHQSYVDGLNKAELKMKEARESNNFDLLKHWEREAAFHGSGHYLHTLFWEIMTPNSTSGPKGEFLQQLEKDFGSFEAFKKHFSQAAKKVEGVGWALLVWSPRSRRLEILQSERHMLLTQWDTIPILVLDVWEHAYYLQYKNDRNTYVDNWWKVVNWPKASKRFEEARKLVWAPY